MSNLREQTVAVCHYEWILAVAAMIMGPGSALPALAVDFNTQIIPVFTKAGCNAGACHGAAVGRGGFKLSLFGGDPTADYDTIVHQYEGRRVNLARPEWSLLLGKPTGQLDHGGGIRLDEDCTGALRIAEWIRAGAPRGGSRRLKQFEVTPSQHVVAQVDNQVQLRALARFDDESTAEDVTPWTVFTATDPAAVEIDAEKNSATVLRRGKHAVVARFLDRAVAFQITLPLSDTPVDFFERPRANFIDAEVYRILTELRLPISDPADDAEFLRRAHLDLTGALPDRNQTEAFLADSSAGKRDRLVDRLLASEDFVNYWTFRFATLLRIHTLPNDRQGARSYHAWLREQIAVATPMDQVAGALLTTTGDSHQIGPANFVRMATDARELAELASDVFMGARLQCANCHNHPLDRWTQDDYHGLAAVFARLDRGRHVKVLSRGAVTNLRTGEPAMPRIPGERYLDPETDRRTEFALWLTEPDNPYFARAMVNRLWQAMFGRGLVEPADDLRDTNPPTHPELLARLAEDFVENGYDIRHTLRLIALSHTYARSSEILAENAADDRFYSRAYCKPLAPEVLADAVFDVTGVADRYGVESLGTRAVELFDAQTPSVSLDILGRCSRQESCAGVALSGGLAAKLHQLNGEFINRKLADAESRLQQMIDAGQTDVEIVTDFYPRALSRRPSEVELFYWREELAGANGSARRAALEDFVWSLLNSQEFTTNH